MRVLWTLSAELDRADIADYIAPDNTLAAIRMDALFAAAVESGLPTGPQMPAASLASSTGAARAPWCVRRIRRVDRCWVRAGGADEEHGAGGTTARKY